MSECAWEPESGLSPELGTEYNSGVEHDLRDDVYSSGGRILHTISSQALSRPVKVPCVQTSNEDKG